VTLSGIVDAWSRLLASERRVTDVGTSVGESHAGQPLHPDNAQTAIMVTLSGIVTLVRPLSANAAQPMLPIVLGRVTLVRPPHPENA